MQPPDALPLVGDPINNPCDTLYFHHNVYPSRASFYSAAPDLSYTRVTKIGLIDPDESIKGHASKNTWKTTSIKFTPKGESFPFAALAPRVILLRTL